MQNVNNVRGINMRENVSKLRKATNDYRLNNSYEMTEDILKYIQERIRANKNEIEELIELKEEKYKYEEIKNAIDEEMEKERKFCIKERFREESF